MHERRVESAELPLAHPYRQALDRLGREGTRGRTARRLSEAIALLDLATALGSGTSTDGTLDAALRIVTRELKVSRGALYVRGEDGALALRASRGFSPAAPDLGLAPPRDPVTALGPGDEAHDRHGLALLVPIGRPDRPVGVLALGARKGRRPYGASEREFVRRVAACAAAPIENGLLQDELRRVNRKLSARMFDLRNLFDVGRDLTGSLEEEEALQGIAMTAAMGHFLVSRCAVYLLGPRGLVLACGRGLGREAGSPPIPPEEARAELEGLAGPRAVADLPEGPLRRRLEDARLALAVPLAASGRAEGVLAIGERASGLPFSEDDRQVAQALARQAWAALENARLRRVREEKQRQDRELQIAREIQQSLFPPRRPEVPGFEVAAASRPCYEVGGDSYDWIALGDGRLAFVVADVAGKGTPASLLMASLHASVQALAGTAPARLVERLNRFLCEKTQACRFATLFYAELDRDSRRIAYVNAGHVPPYRVARDGKVSRLREGGPAVGLLADAAYDVGEVTLEAGDVVAVVTDGVTEAASPAEDEFGDERVCEALRRQSRDSASAVLDGLVAAVDEWVGAGGCRDDLTALILKAC